MSIVKEKGLQHLEMNSSQIVSLLENKHKDDLIVVECKNGETWGARDLLKLDAWVLERTYSPLTTVGYEIKCSRADFEQDQKWVGYLDLCHIFYFVCPAGLIRSTDLPSRVGLIWVSSTGYLHTKKKPERVNPDTEKLNRLLIYVLMARTKIVSNNYALNNQVQVPVDHLAGMRETVQKANEKKELAYFVKGHIQLVSEELRKKESSLIPRENQIKRFEEQLSKLGITWDSTNGNWYDNNSVTNEIALLKKRIDAFSIDQMKRTGEQLIKTADEIFKLHSRD